MASKSSKLAAALRSKRKQPTPPAEQPAKEGTPQKSGTRSGKTPLTAFIDRSAMPSVKMFCIQQGIKSQEQLVKDAVNEYMIKRGSPGVL